MKNIKQIGALLVILGTLTTVGLSTTHASTNTVNYDSAVSSKVKGLGIVADGNNGWMTSAKNMLYKYSQNGEALADVKAGDTVLKGDRTFKVDTVQVVYGSGEVYDKAPAGRYLSTKDGVDLTGIVKNADLVLTTTQQDRETLKIAICHEI